MELKKTVATGVVCGLLTVGLTYYTYVLGFKRSELETCKSSLAVNPLTWPRGLFCVQENGKTYIKNALNEVEWNITDDNFR